MEMETLTKLKPLSSETAPTLLLSQVIAAKLRGLNLEHGGPSALLTPRITQNSAQILTKMESMRYG